MSIVPSATLMLPTTSRSGWTGLASDPSGRSLSSLRRGGSRRSRTTNSLKASSTAARSRSAVFRYIGATSSRELRAAFMNPNTVPRGVSRPSVSRGGAGAVAAGGVAAAGPGCCARAGVAAITTASVSNARASGFLVTEQTSYAQGEWRRRDDGGHPRGMEHLLFVQGFLPTAARMAAIVAWSMALLPMENGCDGV